MTIWSIGHSNRSADDLCATLQAAGVQQVADVRRVPASRRHPQHARAALERGLVAAGIRYAWLGASLGGRMPARLAPEASPNRAWSEPAFRNFADALETPELQAGLAELEALARSAPTAFLCAERDFADCHRRIVADALYLRGWRVLHVAQAGRASEHVLTPFARVDAGVLTYPALL